MARSPSAAVRWAKPSRRGFGGLCLQFVRLAYGVGPKYGYARQAWNASPTKHRTSSTSGIPVGAPIYFDKASSRYGHVAIYVGGGKIATTHASTNRTGVDYISTWTGAYGYKMLGWTEDVNGVRVIPKKTPKKASPRPRKGTHVRVVTKRTHAYREPGKRAFRLLPVGFRFTVKNGSGRRRGLTWYVETTQGNWVRSRKTRKV